MKTFITVCSTLILLSLSVVSRADVDEVVVTIYFAGTNLDSSMWNNGASPFDRAETVASLYHAQLDQPGHHAGFVDGIVQNILNDPILPPWNEQIDRAQSIFDGRPSCTGQCVILNLVGFSRGAVSTMHAAREFYDNETSIKKINVIAFDPVPGDQLRTSGIFVLPPIAEYVGFYANDERSLGFAPVIPDGSDSTESVNFFLVPGAHNTMVGSIQRNGHRDAHGSDSGRLNPLSKTLRIVATELLGSAAWGGVKFAPDGNGSVNLDWIGDETDMDVLRQRFLSDNLLPIFDSYYGFMREFSLVRVGEADLRESWNGGNCTNANTADKARIYSRCAYTGGYNGTPIGGADGPISSASQLDWLDVVDNGEYRLWNLLLERGTLDTDNDGVDYSNDNCKAVANPNQTDSDGDGYGNACDADFNNDCVVNFLDLSLFSTAFLGSDTTFDMNDDGVVNFLDIALVSAAFFSSPGPGLESGICP